MGANAQTTVQKFLSGAVLTAEQQNISAATGVPVFATTVTRDAAFGGANKVLAEGQTCYLESTDVVQFYDGAAWATVGPTAAGGMVSIASGSLTGSSVDLTSISGSYKNLQLILRDFYPVTGGQGFRVRLNNNSTASNYITSTTRSTSTSVGNSTDTQFPLDDRTIGFANSSQGNHLVFDIYDYANADTRTTVNGVCAYRSSTPSNVLFSMSGAFVATTAITQINLYFDAVNFGGGTYVLYGVN